MLFDGFWICQKKNVMNIRTWNPQSNSSQTLKCYSLGTEIVRSLLRVADDCDIIEVPPFAVRDNVGYDPEAPCINLGASSVCKFNVRICAKICRRCGVCLATLAPIVKTTTLVFTRVLCKKRSKTTWDACLGYWAQGTSPRETAHRMGCEMCDDRAKFKTKHCSLHASCIMTLHAAYTKVHIVPQARYFPAWTLC